MRAKVIVLVAFALMLTTPTGLVKADLIDGLVGYWPLDGDALDVSGNGNDGVIIGNVTSTTDRFGTIDSAMNFPGNTNDYIDLGQPPILLIKGAMCVAAWVRADTLSQTGRIIAKQGPSSGRSWGMNLEMDGYARFDIGINATDRIRADSEPLSFGSDEWFHLAGVFRPGEAVELYINGEMVKSEPTTITTQWIENDLPINIGRRPSPGTPWFGDIDEVQMYNVALSPDEIRDAMNGTLLSFPKARNPNPIDGAIHTDTWVNLSWTPGDFAVSHDVYLGENLDDVNEGTRDSDVFRGNQTTNFYVAGFTGFAYPDGLVPETTYYWRIDEVNELHPDSPWKGDVWSFAIPTNKAHDPDPPNGARYVSLNTTLSWKSGIDVRLHHVYFGENPTDVEAGTADTYKGALGSADYTPEGLVNDTVYYWRIDEFDGVETHTGDIWSFTTIPDIPVSDPALVGWWTLDEGQGSMALDWSGHGNDGELQGDPQWIIGHDGEALALDGIDDNVYVASIQLPTSAFTMSLWFYPDITLNASSPRKDFLYWETSGRPHLTFNRSDTGEIGLWPNVETDFDGPITNTRSWASDTWYHVTGTFDGTNFKIYINGNLEDTVLHPGTHSDTSGLFIGCRSNQTNYFPGIIDDVRIYNKALTQEEISKAIRGDPLVAWNPNPGNGSTPYISEAIPLSWSPGDSALQHDVYFGTNKNALNNADSSDTTGIYRGRQNTVTYTPSEGVEWGGGPYYWRIDEVNTDGSISKGRIWSFTVTDFILVDDFESYTDDDAAGEAIWQIWIDGFGTTDNGSQVGYLLPPYAEQTIVHGGSQSMPLLYDNQTSATNSEATLTLTNRRDWTEQNVGLLSLWFRGTSSNAVEPLYVSIANSTGNPAIATHENPNAATTTIWTQWLIPLQTFAEQGINLANVDKIAIGLGSKSGVAGVGGSGTVYIDDIRLYRP